MGEIYYVLGSNVLIYLNAGEENVIKFFRDLLMRKNRLYTDVLVLDEVIYISRKKYGIRYEDTIKFLDDVVLPYVKVLGIGLMEYEVSKKYIGILKPSDAIHVAVMLNNGMNVIVSEDKDFDKVNTVKRVWLGNE